MRRQIMVIPLSFCHLDTVVSDGTQRQIMVILRLLSSIGGGPDGTQRQIMVILHLLSSRGGGPDDMRRQIMVIPHTFSPFRHSRDQWHAETNYGHSASFDIHRRWAR